MSEKTEITRLTMSSYANVIDTLRKESLPPWSDGSSVERCYIIVLEFTTYLPVLVVLFLTLSIYMTYLGLYIIPQIVPSYDIFSLYSSAESMFSSSQFSVSVCCGIMSWSFICFIVSMYKAWNTEPGIIPDDPEWFIYNEDNFTEMSPLTALDRKKDGNKRVCSWCTKKKPDRCHHCRLCNRCVLKMDHHCPWINNCIGYFNYKYFFLTVFYAVVSLAVFQSTFWECVAVVLKDKREEWILCHYVVFVYSIGGILNIAVGGFMIFHLYLMLNQLTTIEFCERRREESVSSTIYNASIRQNIKQALGRKWYMWLVPFCYREPDEKGVCYDVLRA